MLEDAIWWGKSCGERNLDVCASPAFSSVFAKRKVDHVYVSAAKYPSENRFSSVTLRASYQLLQLYV